MTFDIQIARSDIASGVGRTAADIPFVRTMGRAAKAVLSDGMRGRILAVFDRSLYVETNQGALCCIGIEAIGIGPLNALVVGWAGPGTADRRPSVNDPVDIGGALLSVDGCPTFHLDCDRAWSPEWVPAGWSRATLERGIRHLSAAAPSRSPREGLGFILPNILSSDILPEDFRNSPIGRLAGPAIVGLADWLKAVLADDRKRRDAPAGATGLVGMGPGLTPSGDDFLGGILVMLSELGEPEVQRDLAGWLMPVAATRTGTISRAHLACACLGEGAEALHDVLAALLAGDGERIETGLAGIDGLGHSSGWDALAGAALAGACWLRAFGGPSATEAGLN